MQQVATFDVSEQDKCNEFLKNVKPSNMSTKDGRIIIFYDDGTYPVAYQIVDLYEHLDSVRKARFQQEVALHVAKSELADLNPTHNKGRLQEVDQAIRNIEDAIQIQNIKEGFLLKRIEELPVQIAMVDSSKDKSNWGGKRDGAGRRTGSKNIATIEQTVVKEELRQRVLANVGHLVDAQLTLAKGVTHVYRVTIGSRGGRSDPELVTDPDELHEAIDVIDRGAGYGEIAEDGGGESGEDITHRYYFLTTKAPDNKALDSLLDRVFGKATFSMDITSGGQPIAPAADVRQRIDELIES